MIEKKDIDLEKAVLIGVITKSQDETKSKEYLEELEFLTYTAVVEQSQFLVPQPAYRLSRL